jgi:transposase
MLDIILGIGHDIFMKETQTNPTKSIDLSAMSRQELEEFAMRMSVEKEELSLKVKWYEEQLRRHRAEKFGSSSEQMHEHYEQISFFNEAEQDSAEITPEPTIDDVRPKEKKKKQKGRKAETIKNLKAERIDYTLSPEELVCGKCGGTLTEMKTEVRYEITHIPSKTVATKHVQHFYVCRTCDKEGTEGTITSAPAPKGVFRGSLASPSILADIIQKKYALALPLYRQEKELNKAGALLERKTLANWVIQAAKQYLVHLYDYMHADLLTRKIAHADETEVEVLKEPGRDAQTKSFMWLYRTGSDTDRPIVLYEYTPGRAGEYPCKFLNGYIGFLHTDGYAGYHRLAGPPDMIGPPRVIFVGCWTHARRKYTDIIKAMPKGAPLTGSVCEKALAYIGAIFHVESEAKALSPKERVGYRVAKALPIINEYFTWLKSIQASCAGSLSGAVNYSINQEKYLRAYLWNGNLEMSNNRGERSIKPFVIGRKNWLFCNAPSGAEASAIIYSIVETAKENGLDVWAYLEYIFRELKEIPVKDRRDLDMADYMPWSPSLPDECHLPAAMADTDPKAALQGSD